MLFESEWCGDAITAPVLVADDPEDEMLRGLGDRMRSPTDLRLNQGDEAPDCCNLAKSPNRRRWIPLLDLRRAAVENPTWTGDPPYECGLGDG